MSTQLPRPIHPRLPLPPPVQMREGLGAVIAPSTTPITLVTAQIHSNSLFHDYTQVWNVWNVWNVWGVEEDSRSLFHDHQASDGRCPRLVHTVRTSVPQPPPHSSNRLVYSTMFTLLLL